MTSAAKTVPTCACIFRIRIVPCNATVGSVCVCVCVCACARARARACACACACVELYDARAHMIFFYFCIHKQCLEMTGIQPQFFLINQCYCMVNPGKIDSLYIAPKCMCNILILIKCDVSCAFLSCSFFQHSLTHSQSK